MKYKLFPLLTKMIEFYEGPLNRERFSTYLGMMLNEDRSDVVMPIGNFNPMGKEGALEKLHTLQELQVENKIVEEIEKENSGSEGSNHVVDVAINLIDDLGGAWSQRFITEYKSIFDIDHTFKRNFCIIPFWTSDVLSETMVHNRIQRYFRRHKYWRVMGKPITLQEHIHQEVAIEKEPATLSESIIDNLHLDEMHNLAQAHLGSEDHNFIINFFFGDEAVKTLGYPTHGIADRAGFHYVRWLAEKEA